MIMLEQTACKKERSCEDCQTNQPSQQGPGTNNPPIAIAGPDTAITLPIDSITLNGSASNDPDGQIDTWLWKKISGPPSGYFADATLPVTQVTILTEGIYQFELNVTDSQGLFDTDTVSVTVNMMPGNEIIFNNQYWQCWWGCWIDIPELYNYLPTGTTFRVFIKRDNSTIWEEALYGSQTGYGYWVENDGHLIVYGDNLGNDTPDVKIIY